jgi:hypothetical protein
MSPHDNDAREHRPGGCGHTVQPPSSVMLQHGQERLMYACYVFGTCSIDTLSHWSTVRLCPNFVGVYGAEVIDLCTCNRQFSLLRMRCRTTGWPAA